MERWLSLKVERLGRSHWNGCTLALRAVKRCDVVAGLDGLHLFANTRKGMKLVGELLLGYRRGKVVGHIQHQED